MVGDMEITLAELASIVEGCHTGDGEVRIQKAAPFETAEPESITLARSPKYQRCIAETKAGAVIVPADFDYPGLNLLKVENPACSDWSGCRDRCSVPYLSRGGHW